jgi:RHS repeat-associated protein
VQQLRFTYDPTGNVTHVQDDAQQTVFFRNRRVEPSADYVYDAVHRLVAAVGRECLGLAAAPPVPPSQTDAPRVDLPHPGDGNALGIYFETFDYDEVGNLRVLAHRGTDPVDPGWTRTYEYREASQLEPAKTSNRLTTIGDGTHTFDGNGNTLGMGGLPVMTWDHRDRLKSTVRQVAGGGRTPETTWYVYDAAGQRVRKVTDREAAPGETPVRAGEVVYVGDFEVKRTFGGDGLAVASTLETLRLTGEGQALTFVEAANGGAPLVRHQLHNHLGSAVLELAADGDVISYEEYYPYGGASYQAARSKTEAPRRYRHMGKERDVESGLVYFGARYYAPWLGAWTSCDPEPSHGESLYRFVRGNPTTLVDPDGRDATHPTVGLGREAVVAEFAAKIVQLGKDWSTLTPIQRRDASEKAVNAALTQVDAPPIKVVYDDLKGVAESEFDREAWTIKFEEARFASATITPEELIKLGGNLFHEAGHAEGYFLSARHAHRGGEKIPAGQVNAHALEEAARVEKTKHLTLGEAEIARANFKGTLTEHGQQTRKEVAQRGRYIARKGAENKALREMATGLIDDNHAPFSPGDPRSFLVQQARSLFPRIMHRREQLIRAFYANQKTYLKQPQEKRSNALEKRFKETVRPFVGRE